MSNYTTQVRWICESLNKDPNNTKMSDIIESARPQIFDFDYPIFDSKYKKTLETKILRNYYFREIGLETVQLWKEFLNTDLNNIMPYFNQLYKSELIKFDPLQDVNYTRDYKGVKNNTLNNTEDKNNTTTANKTGESNVTDTNTITDTNTLNSTNAEQGKQIKAFNATPQGGLTDVENLAYLTNADINNVTNDSTLTQTGESTSSQNKILKNTDTEKNTITDVGINTKTENVNTTDEYLEIIRGKQGTENYSDILLKFRETFLNIDMQVVDSLKDLFMQIY